MAYIVEFPECAKYRAVLEDISSDDDISKEYIWTCLFWHDNLFHFQLSSRNALRKHIAAHERNYECSVCFQVGVSIRQLKRVVDCF